MGVETESWWGDLLSLRNEMSLRDLSKRFGVSPGDISAALKATQTARTAQGGADLAGVPTPMAKLPKAKSNTGASASDELIHPIAHLLGTISDEEAASQAGVSVRAVAAYRRRHADVDDDDGDDDGDEGAESTDAASGQAPVKFRRSKIDPFIDIVGKLPDREVAQRAKVTLNAVRNYRTNRGIPSSRTWARTQREQAKNKAKAAAAAPVTSTAPAPKMAAEVAPAAFTASVPAPSQPAQIRPVASGAFAWKVRFENGGEGIVTAGDVQNAARLASEHDLGVVSVERLGRLL